jgi:hypothetical protein
MNLKSARSKLGIGVTDELGLRVSVAALARVLIEDPRNADLMLALERRATLYRTQTGHAVEVKSQPFGGALRLHNAEPMRKLIGNFHFDSEESRAEQDFRIFIRPSDWKTVQGFCLEHLSRSDDPVLESDPTRELTEEFADTLGLLLKPDQYFYLAVGTIIEHDPSPTENSSARGYPTARIYRVFEARSLDSSLASTLISNSENYSDQELCEVALQDSQNGGPGRANAVLTLPFKEINTFYRAIPLEARNTPSSFQGHHLDETVAAVLDIDVPKYQRNS